MSSFVRSAVKSFGHSVGEALPKTLRETMMLRAFGLTKVPMILYCAPVVEKLDEQGCSLRIPLTYRTRNHLNSMYFGVLTVGADCASGMIAMYHIRESGEDISLIFKDFKAEFLKRAEGDVVFRCDDGAAIGAMVKQAAATGERVHRTLKLVATVPSISPEVVAKFEITLSLKKSSKSKSRSN